ncbi:MAG: putative bifunctional diguanylate cyclase/phosphodiesterase [Leptospirales bacterium]
MENNRLTVLMVEDNPGDIYLVRELLLHEGENRIELLTSNRISGAIKLLLEYRIDAVLLDLGLPDENGLETVRKIREADEYIPIVILSGLEDEKLAVDAIEMGAQDFLVKGTISGHLLTRSIFYAIKRKEMDRQLNHLSFHDPLTSLANRKMFYERIHRSIDWAERHQKSIALVFLDLNDFKNVNDLFGYTTGDMLLKEVASRLQNALRRTDTIARIGGDEFAIILDDVSDTQSVGLIVQHVLEKITRPYSLDPNEVNIRVSVGISLYPLDGKSSDELIRTADRAMEQSKESGTTQFRFYNNAMEQSERSRRQLQNEVGQAIHNGELSLFYQPKLNLRTGEIFGMEALVRWNHPLKGLQLPEYFLPAIQGTDLIVDLGDWVIREAVRQLEQWRGSSLSLPVSVNVDVLQLKKPEFLSKLKGVLLAHPNVPPQSLELEILETTAMGEFPEMRHLFDEIHRAGVGLTLDDFGTGYSSLAYLKNLPFDTLKIDRSFVMDMVLHREDLAIIESVSSLAHIFERTVIAEGMEKPEYGAILLRLGCDRAQGFAISPPMPAAQIPHWIEAWAGNTSWAIALATQPDASDISLLNAQTHHLSWIQGILSDPLGAIQPVPSPPTPSHSPIRTWLEGPGQDRFGRLSAFREICHLDKMIEETGECHHRQKERGQSNPDPEIRRKILALKDALLGKYAELQKEFLLSSLLSGEDS